MRILLVEDDKLIGDGIKAGLSKMGLASTGLPQARRAKTPYIAPLMTPRYLT